MKTKTKLSRYQKQDEQHNFRSVGAKPYDFNKLKYTTSYRNFHRRSLPQLQMQHQQTEKQPIFINMKQKIIQKESEAIYIEKQRSKQKSRQREKQRYRKERLTVIDKWKEKYEKTQEIKNKIQYRSAHKYTDSDGFPSINKRISPIFLHSTHERFKYIRNATQIRLAKQKHQFKNVRKVPEFNKFISETDNNVEDSTNAFHKYQSYFKNNDEVELVGEIVEQGNSNNLQKGNSLDLQQRLQKLTKKKKKMKLTENLGAVQEMPERWQVNLQQEQQP